MSVTTQNNWENIGCFTDGSPILAIRVFNGYRMVGRVVDMLEGYRADFVNTDGRLVEIMFDEYFEAVARIAEEAYARHRTLN